MTLIILLKGKEAVTILFATFSTLCHDYTVPHEFLMCLFIINNSQSQGGDFVAEMLKT